jgi:hypothetical protein
LRFLENAGTDDGPDDDGGRHERAEGPDQAGTRGGKLGVHGSQCTRWPAALQIAGTENGPDFAMGAGRSGDFRHGEPMLT